LKCEVVPRADCSEISTISPTIVSAIVHRMRWSRRACRGSASGMNHAIVHRKIAIDEKNFIGLIHGLMPRIARVSTAASAAAPASPPIISQPTVVSSGSRHRSSATIVPGVILRLARCFLPARHEGAGTPAAQSARA
jgi:hypothetical protein